MRKAEQLTKAQLLAENAALRSKLEEAEQAIQAIHSGEFKAQERSTRLLREHQQGLEESEERFRRYFELGLIGMAIASPTKGMIEVNDELCKMLGYERGELLEKTWAELTHPDDLAANIALFKRAVAGGIDSYKLDKRLIRKDGQVIEASTSVRVLRRADGSVEHFIALLQDITEHKRADLRLAADLNALTRMHAISSRVLEAGGLESLLQEIMDASLAIMKAEKGTLRLREDNSLRIAAHRGHQERFLEFFSSAENPASACGEVLKREERVVVPDVEKSPLFAGAPSLSVLREADVRAVQSTPMISRTGALLGILTTQWDAPHTPDEHDLWQLDLLARQAADLIEHTRAEEALHSSEERFRRYFELGLIGMAVASPTQYLTEVNDELCKMLGYERFELLGRAWAELTHPDDLAADADRFHRAMAGEIDGYRLEKRLIRKDGRFVDVSTSVRALRRADGSVDCFLALLRDITDRKRAEEALRASEEVSRGRAARLQATLDAAPLLILTAWDRDSRCITGNREAERFLRVSEGVNMSKTGTAADRLAHYRIFKGGVELKPEEMPIQRVAASGRPLLGYSCDFVFDDGTARSLLGNVVPFFDDSGQPCGAIAAYMDVTEHKRMEEELRRSRDVLEIRVQERTAELERKNQELQDFAFIASHDLSEPLRKIQTFGTLLAEKSADLLGEQQRDYISRMTGAADRMHVLLDALLGYSRVDTKGQEFRPSDLDGIVREAVSDLEVAIGKVGARVEIGPLPCVKGDSLQLRQLFQNLISNSLKYYRAEVKPFVGIHGEESNGNCRVFVEDRGIGFDEKYLDKIFQPFQRLHGRNEYAGIGMGLAICRKIVERHHGTITAKSTPGKGSTFIITLPVKQ